MAIPLDQHCPCGSKKTYATCCHPLHQGGHAVSPEALMRSRYTAFVLKLTDYLLRSWHPDTRPSLLDLGDSPEWVQLQVLHSHQQGNGGRVHFRALFRDATGLGFLEEKSKFTRVDGQWFYVSGNPREGRLA